MRPLDPTAHPRRKPAYSDAQREMIQKARVAAISERERLPRDVEAYEELIKRRPLKPPVRKQRSRDDGR